MQDHRPIKWLEPVNTQFLARLYQKEYAYTLYRKFRTHLDGRPFVTQEQYDHYFKFTFVRNPWARVHSWYKNILDDPIHMKTYDVPADASLAWFVRNRLYTVESQLHFIRDLNGKIALDFVGRYENLYEDFEFVCQTLGIEDYTLPEKTRIGTPSYIPAYDEETMNIVTENFQEEIELFSFKFGDRIIEGRDQTVRPVADLHVKREATPQSPMIVSASS